MWSKIYNTTIIVSFLQAYTIGGDQLYARPVFRMYTGEKNRAQFLTPSVEDVIR